MIKVYKSPDAPSSLATTTRYDGEDVKLQLLADQHDKCYICERRRDTDYEIEHHKSVDNYPALSREWGNLFLSCKYCNGKKSNSFDDTLNPKDCGIEEDIEQRVDFANKKALFFSNISDPRHTETIRLLNRIYNGAKRVRTIKEERFMEQAISVVNRFLDLAIKYQETPDVNTEKAIINELAVEQELLGFKYWIIRDNPALYSVFGQYMTWNR